MRYLNISHATSEVVIGEAGYPQCKPMPSGMFLTRSWFDRPGSFTHMTNEREPDFKPDLLFELEDKAILTDVVSPSNLSARGFLVNERTKELLSKFHLMEHRVYPGTLIVKGSRVPYYWIHFIENREHFLRSIDYERSQFHVANLVFTKIEDVDISSYEEYLDRRAGLSMRYITASKLVMLESFHDRPYDLFYIRYIYRMTFVSEVLARTIATASITGLDITDQQVLAHSRVRPNLIG